MGKLISPDLFFDVFYDKLVVKTTISVFNHRFYQKHLAENWLFYLNDKETAAIPFAYKLFLGKKIIFNPVFYRYAELIGEVEDVDFDDLKKVLEQNFRFGDFNFRNALPINFESNDLVNQVVTPCGLRLKTLTKRMLKKASKFDFQVSENGDRMLLFNIITEELSEKLDVFNDKNIHRLNLLIDEANKANKLKTFFLYKENVIQGGLFVIPDADRWLYLKGTVRNFAKQNGGMYLLMHHAIIEAHKNNAIFDFGGSNVAGVRDFNYKFGALDETYYAYSFGKSSFSFKLYNKLRLWLKK